MNIFIMAQGRQTRMFGRIDYPKQCIEVGGERIIDRMSRLFGPATVICRPELKEIIKGNPLFRFVELKDPGDCIIQGLQRARGLWDTGADRTLILLGDVFFDERAALAIMNDPRDIFFAGEKQVTPNQGELFALSFRSPGRIVKALEKTPCMTHEVENYQSGHLRQLLWALQDGKKTAQAEYHLPISDFTTDFDDPHDLLEVRKIEAASAPPLSGLG